MNFISLLSEKIELGAIFVSNIIIYFLPFMSDVLLDKPENIMKSPSRWKKIFEKSAILFPLFSWFLSLTCKRSQNPHHVCRQTVTPSQLL